jgi:hypothetical protein
LTWAEHGHRDSVIFLRKMRGANNDSQDLGKQTSAVPAAVYSDEATMNIPFDRVSVINSTDHEGNISAPDAGTNFFGKISVTTQQRHRVSFELSE